MVTFIKQEPENINDPIDIMQTLSRLIHQQKERIARLIEMEPSNPKLSPHIGKEMQVLASLVQHYRNMACDLGLLPRSPKVVTVFDALPTPVQAKFQDQMMRGMQEQERAKEEAFRRAAWEAAQQEITERRIAKEFSIYKTDEERNQAIKEALTTAFNTIYWKRKEAEEKGLLR